MLTKTDYMLGLSNIRTLWQKKKGLLEFEASEADQFTIDQGIYVGELARNYFKNGFLIDSKNKVIGSDITKQVLDKHDILFEASFIYDDCFNRVDILRRNGDGWDIIEVKGSTKLKDDHIIDVSFQKFVCKNSGIKVKNVYIMLLNNKYERKEELDLNQLFYLENVSEMLFTFDEVEKDIKIIKEVIDDEKEPVVFLSREEGIFNLTYDEYFEKLPSDSVFNLSRGGKKSYSLYEKGISSIKEIDSSVKLSENQSRQVSATKENCIFRDDKFIREWFEKLEYPLYYLDFECVNLAVPLFNEEKPYEQIPFQYSCHIVNKVEELIHKEFLAQGNLDPRDNFIESLLSIIGEKGSIIVYNKAFEKMILKRLSAIFPKHSSKIEKVIDRLIDLYDIFRTFSYYDPIQKGSASIKKVLPALTGKDYSNMDIDNGALASAMFYRATFDKTIEFDISKVREDLLKYCELDTYGMVLIVDKLKELLNIDF